MKLPKCKLHCTSWSSSWQDISTFSKKTAGQSVSAGILGVAEGSEFSVCLKNDDDVVLPLNVEDVGARGVGNCGSDFKAALDIEEEEVAAGVYECNDESGAVETSGRDLIGFAIGGVEIGEGRLSG
jgi:hypothetical protein